MLGYEENGRHQKVVGDGAVQRASSLMNPFAQPRSHPKQKVTLHLKKYTTTAESKLRCGRSAFMMRHHFFTDCTGLTQKRHHQRNSFPRLYTVNIHEVVSEHIPRYLYPAYTGYINEQDPRLGYPSPRQGCGGQAC